MRTLLVVFVLLLTACSTNPDIGRADYDMGMNLLQGNGIAKNAMEAARHLTLASEAGNIKAHTALGYLYLKGTGVTKDEKHAFALFLKAAKKGDPDAQYNTGLSYVRGIGTAPDLKEAFDWFEKAALQDDVGSQYNLGVMTMNGEGTKEDPVLAYAWFSEAYEKHYDGAEEGMQSAKHAMSDQQLKTLDVVVAKVAGSITRSRAVDTSVRTGAANQPL